MSTPPAPAAGAAAPKKGMKKILLVAVCICCPLLGGALPMVVNVPAMVGKSKEEKGKKKEESKTAVVPFGEVVVNLSEGSLQRYLRIKVAVLVDEEAEKEVELLLTKKKAAVKSAMIAHLAGKTLKDVSGSVGVTRMQRELLERVEDVLYPEGHSQIKSVLFEEYVVQ